MNNQVSDLIKWWIIREKNINQNNRDIFISFFIYYVCFDAWLTAESGKNSDEKKIKWLINDGGVLKRVFDNKEFDHSSLNALKKLSPLEDMCPGHKGNFTRLKDTDDLDEVTRFIYQIRCNLFHGSKNPNNGRDNRLISSAGDFLGKWIRCAHLITK
jgi:hypothetical protein